MMPFGCWIIRKPNLLICQGGKLDIDPDLREAIKNANDSVKIAVEQMRKDFVLDPEDIMLEDLAKLHHDAEAIVELVLEFNQAYRQPRRSGILLTMVIWSIMPCSC